MSDAPAIYPGSFDPVTYGHLDIIQRALAMFGHLIVAVAASDSKQPLFNLDERAELIRAVLPTGANVTVKTFDDLLIHFAKREGAFTVIRGLRAVSDFEFEFQMALMNRRLDARLETVFLTPKEECTFISSRIVKEVARLGGDVSPFVPPSVIGPLTERARGLQNSSTNVPSP
ncbi:MAG: pantetheine-phosphate adenylyltransferase [Chthoniobacterales bacterium]